MAEGGYITHAEAHINAAMKLDNSIPLTKLAK